jgi:hypothetical protein
MPQIIRRLRQRAAVSMRNALPLHQHNKAGDLEQTPHSRPHWISMNLARHFQSLVLKPAGTGRQQ